MKFVKLVVVFVFFSLLRVYSQCGTIISTFPYFEGFEINSSWTVGGASSDWDWGTPNHPLISSASEGTKAWCAGGLTGSSYNANQQSFLLSPCFDFTNLDNPWISFDIFWEVEYQWDGVTFQYTLDDGNNWFNVGAYNDPVDCFNDNWFNYDDINWLTEAIPKHGWTGRQGNTSGACEGGFGSEEWLTAQHCLNNLANEPNVRFRFLFGSGNSCNDYDGIGIDAITIQNAPNTTVDFSHTCVNGNELSFSNLSDACSLTFSWDFDDVASGASNLSNLENTSHLFSQGGTYDVELSVTGSCNQTTSISKTITILSSDITSQDVSCFGQSDGSASANGLASSSYSWNTIPVQTSASIGSLVAGNYTVEITDPNACTQNLNVTINEPNELTLTIEPTPTCEGACTGSLEMFASGGTQPYVYVWDNIAGGTSISGSVCSGTYTAQVTDAIGCEANSSAVISENPLPDLICPPANICIGSTATLNASGASLYSWSPSLGLSATSGASVIANPAESTTYFLTGTSIDGCVSSIEVVVSVSDVFAPTANFTYFPNPADVFNPDIDFVNTSTEASNYEWNFYNVYFTTILNPSHTFPSETWGIYEVCLTASNSLSCSSTNCKQIEIKGNASVFVPNTFSPNNDKNNNFFSPSLRDVDDESYLFTVYNRWGERVFTTTDIFESWDGTYLGKECPTGIYTWKLTFQEINTDNDQKLKGHVLLVR